MIWFFSGLVDFAWVGTDGAFLSTPLSGVSIFRVSWNEDQFLQFNLQTSEIMRNASMSEQLWDKYHRWVTIFEERP